MSSRRGPLAERPTERPDVEGPAVEGPAPERPAAEPGMRSFAAEPGMRSFAAEPGMRSFAAIGTICHVLSTRPDQVSAAAALVKQQLVELDQTCSRFRRDSELSRLERGHEVAISPLLTDLLVAALRTARLTSGLVDPTVSLSRHGYDADLDVVRARPAASEAPRVSDGEPAPGYWRIMLDEHRQRVVIPHHLEVDLGASAKAWAADRAARDCAALLSGGFLVNLGGDLAVSGEAPSGGWQVAIDDATEVDSSLWPAVSLSSGGLATSSTAVRTWRVGDRLLHHIVDPRTGQVAEAVWRAVTVAAASAERANAAATAAIVLGREAPAWLAMHRLPARLMSATDLPVYVGDWPADEPALLAGGQAAGPAGSEEAAAAATGVW